MDEFEEGSDAYWEARWADEEAADHAATEQVEYILDLLNPVGSF